MPHPYRKGVIDTLSIQYQNQDTLVFYVGEDQFLKVNNQVFLTSYSHESDTILAFDYSLKTGDSITMTNLTYRIDTVMDVVYHDGNTYREWYLNNGIVWKENLGTNWGWLWWFSYLPTCQPTTNAICHNNNLIFWDFGILSNGSDPDPTCNFDSLMHKLSVKQISNPPQIQVFPNPALDHVWIDECLNCEYEILDPVGKSLKKGVVQDSISVSELKPGIYHFVLWTNNSRYTVRLIKL